MSDQTLLMLLVFPAVLAFAFGIWAGLGYPGMYDKYEKTGKAPRESPLLWLVRGGKRPTTSEMQERQKEEEEAEKEREERERARPSFDRGRRFRR